MTEEPQPEQVQVENFGHVLDVDGGIGQIEPRDGSAPMPVVFLILSGVDSDGNDFSYKCALNAFMAQRLGVYASQGALTLTEIVAQQIAARRLEEQNQSQRKERNGYL